MANRSSTPGTPNAPGTPGQPAGSRSASAIDSVGRAGSVAPSSAVEPTSAVGAVASSERVEAVAGAAPVDAAAAVSAAQRVLASDRVQGIIDGLRRGTISPNQAVQELIDDVVQRSLPGVSPDSPLVAQLRTLLSAYAKDDPYLASRIERLGPPSSPGTGR